MANIIQVGGSGKHTKATKKQLVVLFVVCIIAAAVAGIGVRWWLQDSQHKQDEAKQKINQQVEKSQNLALTGKYDEAQKAIDDELAKPGVSNDTKFAMYFQQGLNYENQKKFDEAINSYKQAEALNNNQAVAEAIARTAESKGDKEMAITYYKKALSLIPADFVTAESARKTYETFIKNLGGQP